MPLNHGLRIAGTGRHKVTGPTALFSWNNTDLTQFTVFNNSPSVQPLIGPNPGSPNGTDTNQINDVSNLTWEGASLAGLSSPYTFVFDWWQDATTYGGVYSWGSVIFSSSISGAGPALSLIGSGRGGQGIYTSGGSSVPPSGPLGTIVGSGSWSSNRIEYDGMTAKWYLWNGSIWVLEHTVTISGNGTYFFLGGGGTYSQGYFTNIFIYSGLL